MDAERAGGLGQTGLLEHGAQRGQALGDDGRAARRRSGASRIAGVVDAIRQVVQAAQAVGVRPAGRRGRSGPGAAAGGRASAASSVARASCSASGRSSERSNGRDTATTRPTSSATRRAMVRPSGSPSVAATTTRSSRLMASPRRRRRRAGARRAMRSRSRSRASSVRVGTGHELAGHQGHPGRSVAGQGVGASARRGAAVARHRRVPARGPAWPRCASAASRSKSVGGGSPRMTSAPGRSAHRGPDRAATCASSTCRRLARYRPPPRPRGGVARGMDRDGLAARPLDGDRPARGPPRRPRPGRPRPRQTAPALPSSASSSAARRSHGRALVDEDRDDRALDRGDVVVIGPPEWERSRARP